MASAKAKSKARKSTPKASAPVAVVEAEAPVEQVVEVADIAPVSVEVVAKKPVASSVDVLEAYPLGMGSGAFTRWVYAQPELAGTSKAAVHEYINWCGVSTKPSNVAQEASYGVKWRKGLLQGKSEEDMAAEKYVAGGKKYLVPGAVGEEQAAHFNAWLNNWKPAPAEAATA